MLTYQKLGYLTKLLRNSLLITYGTLVYNRLMKNITYIEQITYGNNLISSVYFHVNNIL